MPIDAAPMTATPLIDAAIRAGCARDCILKALDCHAKRPCEGSGCECGVSETIWTALRAAVPRDPTQEWIEAVARGIADSEGWHPWMQLAETALAAYRAQPLWRELYGENVGND